jgi:hypothetical protein
MQQFLRFFKPAGLTVSFSYSCSFHVVISKVITAVLGIFLDVDKDIFLISSENDSVCFVHLLQYRIVPSIRPFLKSAVYAARLLPDKPKASFNHSPPYCGELSWSSCHKQNSLSLEYAQISSIKRCARHYHFIKSKSMRHFEVASRSLDDA